MGIRSNKKTPPPTIQIPVKTEEDVLMTLDEPTLTLPNQPEEDDSSEALSQSGGEGTTVSEPTRKRKRTHLCDKCHAEEATQIKKLRKHSWTEKNKESFAKCQETKRLKQAFDKAVQVYGKILATLELDNDSVSSEDKQAAKDTLVSTKKAYDEYLVQLAETRSKKAADKEGQEVQVK
jgi:uncharacterized protein YukE